MPTQDDKRKDQAQNALQIHLSIVASVKVVQSLYQEHGGTQTVPSVVVERWYFEVWFEMFSVFDLYPNRTK